jgi:DNA repair exonuclease SbcCD nuclease subunit
LKIAVTADVHLTTREDNPERFNALADILDRLVALDIDQLIIAGDLFDKDVQNYSEFEALCNGQSGVTIHVIPGNHDPSMEAKRFAADNIHAYSEATRVDLGATFLFVPYQHGISMGEAIAPECDNLEPNKWVLVSHGDYYGGSGQPNPYEQGTYMPLSRSDVERFRPRTVLLGHIHVPSDEAPIYYPGSPCGLDISEVGHRRFLVYDTETAEVSPYRIQTDVLYFQESFVVVPCEDEVDRLSDEIQRRIDIWGLDESDQGRVQLRVDVRGFCIDKHAITNLLNERFADFAHYKGEPPDVANLSVSTNNDLRWIASRVEKLIDELDWQSTPEGDLPDRDEIMNQALQVIYGEGGA